MSCNPCNIDGSAILEFFKIALPFAAAVAGWFVASSLQDKRERRKEIRMLIDETKDVIEGLYSLTLKYYSKSNKSAINEISAEMKFKKLLISQYFIIINQAGLETRGTAELIEFTNLATGGVFETPDYKSLFEDHDWHGRLAAAAHELSMLLDKRYFSTFKLRSMRQYTADQ